jgi:hypothetical protein
MFQLHLIWKDDASVCKEETFVYENTLKVDRYVLCCNIRGGGGYYAFLGRYIQYSGNSSPTFRHNLSVPSSEVKKSYSNCYVYVFLLIIMLCSVYSLPTGILRLT